MNEKQPFLTIETLLYIVIFLFAGWLRFTQLGQFPLSDQEAVHALAAASVTPDASAFWNEGKPSAPSNAAYQTFTAAIFQLVGSSESSARLISALAGLGLVFTPLFARRRFGPVQTLIFTALLGFSPLLITVSRTAGSPSLAQLGLLAAVLLLIGCETELQLRSRVPWIAGFMGLALASGASILLGLLTLVSGSSIFFLFSSRNELLPFRAQKRQVQTGAGITLGVMFLLASGFGLSLSGVSGLGEALGSWLSAWFSSGELSAFTGLTLVPIYEPLIFGFGLIGVIACIRKPDALKLGALGWSLSSMVVFLMYPGRQPADALWGVIPLAYLASGLLAVLADRLRERRSWLEFSGLAGTLVGLGALELMNLRIYATSSGNVLMAGQLDPALRLIVIFGLLVVAVLIAIFFGMGWDRAVAVEASGLSALLFLILFTVSTISRLNYLDRYLVKELWRPEATTLGAFHTVKAIEMISLANTGRPDSLDVRVEGASITPSMAWLLRRFAPGASEAGTASVLPAMVLVPRDQELTSLRGEYIGQSFEIRERWSWTGWLPPEPIKWWVVRDAPTIGEYWRLLVRVDLANLGEELLTSPETE